MKTGLGTSSEYQSKKHNDPTKTFCGQTEDVYVKTMEKVDKEQTLPREPEQKYGKRKLSPFGHLFRFYGWWFGFTGLYSMFAVCPFCGQQGCPVGLASAGTFGAFFALCIQDWKLLFRFLKHKRAKKTKKETGSNNPVSPDKLVN